MKKFSLLLFSIMLLWATNKVSAQAPVPELLYYTFNGAGTAVPNLATSPPAGTGTAVIMGGQTQGGTGQCGGALIGTGLSSTNDYVNTGWVTDLNGTSWTLSFWTNNVPSTTTTYYILGDVNAGGFRVFTGGVAGAGNWILRGGFTDIIATGGAATGPTITTFVYDMPNNEIRAYVNGTLISTVAQTTVTISGPGPFKVGGYSSSNSLPTGSLMDEFRLYNRVLSVAEIQSLANLNTTSTIAITACDSYTTPSGLHTYTTSGTYNDTITNLAGCDSIISINLTINNSTTSSINASACDSYTSPSGNYTWTTSGTYNDTLTNSVGCDSVITVNLTINQSTSSTINEVACGIYTTPSGLNTFTNSGVYTDVITNSAGCDSTITINLTINNATASSISEIACDSYTSPSGVVYTASGVYNDTIPNSVGCDSVITITLVINNSTSSTITEVVCDSYTSPAGSTIIASGTYTETIPNSVGCDSVITINLTVNTSSSSTISPVACNSYTSPAGNTITASGTYTETITNSAGCDSIITINLTINTPTASAINATACGSYTTPSGNVVNASGTFNDAIANSNGCDSVITITLVINNVNAAATQAGPVLTATAVGAAYQWIDCQNNSPINGAIAQVYTATANGSYAVIVTENGCTDTSSCLTVTGISIAEVGNLAGNLNMFPNPTSGMVTVSSTVELYNAVVRVYSHTGQLVMEQNIADGKIFTFNTSELAAGIYVVDVTSGSNFARVKLVKN